MSAFGIFDGEVCIETGFYNEVQAWMRIHTTYKSRNLVAAPICETNDKRRADVCFHCLKNAQVRKTG